MATSKEQKHYSDLPEVLDWPSNISDLNPIMGHRQRNVEKQLQFERNYVEADISNSIYSNMNTATLTQTKLIILYPNEVDYTKAHNMFNQHMPNSTIQAIFRLQMPDVIVDKHLALKGEMAKIMNSADKITHQMFHGTKTSCDPMRLITTLAPSCASNCGVCGIIREGNRCAYSKSGCGMWFAKQSSMSHMYCDNGKPVKAMFIVDVLAMQSNDVLTVNKDE
ncbi:14585_t:CDS:2, partial [Ambispora leptoticha]